ncbi:MAG: helicase HerA domain-containing protein [Candidatus Hodarchaeales archaeon]
MFPQQLRGQVEKIPLSAFENHASIWGLTGEGKSRFLYGLSKEIMKSGVKLLIIDLKGEYHPAIGDDDLIYLKPGSKMNPFMINMFELPVGLQVEDHVQFIYSTFVNVIGSENISPQMNELLRKGILHTVQTRGDFKYFLETIEDPLRLDIKGSYLESTAAALYQRISKFSFGTAGKVFDNGKSNINISAFLKNNIILDLQLFNTNENFTGLSVFLNVLFHQFFHALKRERKSINISGNIRNMIIIDESQLVIGFKDRKKDRPSIIEKLPWVIRAYGCSMIFAGTDPIISDTLLYNTGLSIVFFTKQSPVIMSNILGTTVANYLNLRDKLEKRMFILSIRGQMTILKTLEFSIKHGSYLIRQTWGQDRSDRIGVN